MRAWWWLWWNSSKLFWSHMLEPFWHHTGPDDWKKQHRNSWLAGWAWTIAGLALGAFVAPSLVPPIMQRVGLPNTAVVFGVSVSTPDVLNIGVSLLGGILVQVAVAFLMGLVVVPLVILQRRLEAVTEQSRSVLLGEIVVIWLKLTVGFLLIPAPLAAVGYALYRYLNWVGPGQRQVVVAAAGGTLIKVFILPGVRSVLRSAAVQRLKDWLRPKLPPAQTT